ncbi:hypothetical protein DEJ47_27355 [Streptomyces venezuelae]|uniref:Uncharacterized protein n=1 Tax=Streptomyces venezuelae TaxID=54571 RepID=A0A5P2BGS9_STRVZ|nr:hypothetical protein DEJ47_27355 [Streptomyces venezuelae]
MTGSTTPMIPRAPCPAAVGPGNEKTPRGCERSARGSRRRCPPVRDGYEAVTADRRACCQ